MQYEFNYQITERLDKHGMDIMGRAGYELVAVHTTMHKLSEHYSMYWKKQLFGDERMVDDSGAEPE